MILLEKVEDKFFLLYSFGAFLTLGKRRRYIFFRVFFLNKTSSKQIVVIYIYGKGKNIFFIEDLKDEGFNFTEICATEESSLRLLSRNILLAFLITAFAKNIFRRYEGDVKIASVHSVLFFIYYQPVETHLFEFFHGKDDITWDEIGSFRKILRENYGTYFILLIYLYTRCITIQYIWSRL